MQRLFPRVESAAVARSAFGLLLVPALAVSLAACEPSNKVKPGAPVLVSLSILEASGTRTDVTETTAECAADAAEGSDCDPMAPVCRLTKTFCHCVPKAKGDCSINPDAATTGGTWACHYGPQLAVLATFDRLLDTAPLDPAGNSDLVALTTSATPAMQLSAPTAYNPNGSDVSLVYSVFFGVPLGPSLFITPAPATPAGANVTFTMDGTKVRAKDGKTAFTGGGLLQSGILSFDTAAFSASIAVPVAPPPDPDAGVDAGASPDADSADGGATDAADPDAAAPDAMSMPDAGMVCMPPPPPPAPEDVPPGMDPITITFNNPVDRAAIVAHVHVTSNGTALTDADITIATGTDDGATTTTTVTIKPASSWPATATIVVTVDGAASDILGATLGADATGAFTTTDGS